MPRSSPVPTGHRQTQACGAEWRRGSRSISRAGRARTAFDLVTVGQQEVLGEACLVDFPSPVEAGKECVRWQLSAGCQPDHASCS